MIDFFESCNFCRIILSKTNFGTYAVDMERERRLLN